MPLGGDVVQLSHKMSQGVNQILNVYYFEAVDGTATLSGLASWFSTNIVPKVKASQSSGVAHDALELVNLFDKGEQHILALSGTGGLTGTDQFPAFHSAGLRLKHTTAGMRSGWKRFGPAVEAQASANNWVAGHITLIDAIGAALLNPLSPALATWAHVVVQRVKVIDVVTGEVTYRLPESQTELTVGYPVDYETSPYVTTQNSRKVYAST